MVVVWILLAVLAVLLAAGYGLFHYTFVRRRIPDPTTQEGRENGGWEKYERGIISGAQWLAQQEVKPLQVISYDGKRLYGRFVPCENAKGTILFFHGYRSHYQVDFSASMQYYHELGYHMLFVDQRAHGLSGGRCITFGVKERFDVMSWVTYLSLMLGENHPMFISGLSMGATTVLMAADMEFPANVRGIIADCGFSSPADILQDLAERHYHMPGKAALAVLNGYTRVFAGFGLREWSTADALRNTKLPVLLTHGLADRLVPSRMSEYAYEACAGERRIELFPDAGHGVSYLQDRPRYQKALREFLDQYTKDEETA